jgi:hypothetical protein
MAKYFFITVFVMSLAMGSVFAEEKKKEKTPKEMIEILGGFDKNNLVQYIH